MLHFLKENLNLKGHLNGYFGSKFTAILVKGGFYLGPTFFSQIAVRIFFHNLVFVLFMDLCKRIDQLIQIATRFRPETIFAGLIMATSDAKYPIRGYIYFFLGVFLHFLVLVKDLCK